MLYYLVDASAIVCALACLHLLHTWRRNRSRPPLPPGPKGLLLIGNVLDMPEAEEWEAARKWGETYGSLIHVENLGKSYIFVNSYESAVDLFEKRGSNYSSRPKSVMIDLEGLGWTVSMMPYGDELRKSRQLLHHFFQPATVNDYVDLQLRSTHRMLEGLLMAPDRYPELLRYSVGETILKAAYDYQVLQQDDPYVTLAEKAVEAGCEAQEFFLVNVFPWLQYLPSWFPGAGFQRIAKEGYRLSMSMHRDPYEMAKAKFLEGTAAPSMISKLIEANMGDDGVVNNEILISQVAGTAYGGKSSTGADTSVSALHSFFLAMLLYPDVQERAQGELDRVVGKDTLPTIGDRPNLPYINAIIKETLRWQPVTPLAVAHIVEEDDEYNGYFIPSGATMLPNLWAMMRDPTEYPEPDEFIPERWLYTEGKEPPLDVYKIAFGIGRRICPGRHFADTSVFIGAASILSTFNITKALDENGVPITPTVEYTTHIIRHPKPFKYVLTPRSDNIKTVIRQAVDATK